MLAVAALLAVGASSAPLAARADAAPAAAAPSSKGDAAAKPAAKAGTLPGVVAPTATPQSEITSDQLDYDFDKRLATFTGHVHALKDDMDLYSDQMVVNFTAENEIQTMEATKSVRIVKDDKIATSGKANYDVAKDVVTLTDSPIMTQGPNRLTGAETLIYHQKEGRFETKGGRARLQMQKKGGQQSSAFPALVPAVGAPPSAVVPAADNGRQIVTADTVAYNPTTRKVDFVGNVEVEDGEVHMSAARMAASLSAQNEVEHLDASEKVVITRDGRRATSNQAAYDLAVGNIVLTGSPELNQEGGRLVDADRIVYRRDTGKLTAEGGRPRLLLDKAGKDSDFVLPGTATGTNKGTTP